MSPKEEFRRMRGSNSRRWVRSAMPTRQMRPATPPTTIAIICLKPWRDAERVEHPDRRQQADEMAGEDDQDADMEEVRAPHQLAAAKQLARSAPPRVLLAVEADDAADDEDRQAEIGIPAEDRVVEKLAHGVPPIAAARQGASRPGCGRPGRPCSRSPPRDRTMTGVVLPGRVERGEIVRIDVRLRRAAPPRLRRSRGPAAATAASAAKTAA